MSGGRTPDEPGWLGDDAGPCRELAEIWATVDLERVLADVASGVERAFPGDVEARREPPGPLLHDPLIGARIRLLRPPDRAAIALAEPSTEGRLAATLARHGEGGVGRYLAVPAGLDAVRGRAAAAGVPISRPETGPFGPEVLVLGGRVGGRIVILVEAAAVPSPP